MGFDPKRPLPSLKTQALKKYFTLESQYMAAEGYIESKYEIIRRNALHTIVNNYKPEILQKNYKPENFDAFIPYLAMNYFDRYISRYGLALPHTGNTVRDEVCLVAFCCLTIAWKMRNKSFKVSKLVEETKLKIKGTEIMKVELKILNILDWHMRSVMPFCFLDHFVQYFQGTSGFRRRCINEIIIQSQGDINYTRFRPSVIAISALLAASSFLHGSKIHDCTERVVREGDVQEELLNDCLERITGLCMKYKILMESARPENRETLRMLAEEGTELMDVRLWKGKAPMEVGSTSGKDSMWESEISEIEEDPDSEEYQNPQMNFELKWITGENKEEDLTINSPLFRQPGEGPLDGSGVSFVKDESPACKCCNVL